MPTRPRDATVWWIRRDVRLHDAAALDAALRRGGAVVPVFVVDPALLASRMHRHAERRRDFLFAGLRVLDEALRARGSRLVVRRGAPHAVLAALVAETGAAAVVAESDVSPYARRRDARVRRAVPLELVGHPTIRDPTAVLKEDGTPYAVFSPFRKAWLARPLPTRAGLLSAPDRLPPVPDAVASEPLPADGPSPWFPPGEPEARRRLEAFAAGRRAAIHRYGAERDRVDRDGTSALSPYLRFGMISARAAAVAAIEAGGTRARSGAAAWLSELVWRDFYQAILFHFPDVLRTAFDPGLRGLAFRTAPDDLRAWQDGRTGYPIVDAAMRQLAATGWIHNRARMIVASFLVKDLLLDWRAGEAWFARHLLDGDPAANNGGWQWTAGVGTDAAPYFRVFNPSLQAKRCDPAGDYVRRWVPELARVPSVRVHEPWTLSPIEQRAAGCVVGRDYPAPLVDHHAARDRALAAYRSARAARAAGGAEDRP